MPKMVLNCTINGEATELLVQPYHTLLEALRDVGSPDGHQGGLRHGRLRRLHRPPGRQAGRELPGAGDAGARARRSDGRGPGLDDGALHPVQNAFVKHGVPQCGFCIPGMIMSASALLEENPAPSEEEIRLGIAGNLCRCTGYTKMVAAITEALPRATAKEG